MFQKRSFTNAQVFLLLAAALAIGAFFFTKTKGPTTKEVHEEARQKEEQHEHGGISITAEEQKNAGLKFEEVLPQPMQAAVDVTGTVQPNDTRLSHLRLLSRGRIEKVNVRLGDRVQAGQVLLTYDNIELGEILAQATSATAALEQATTEAEVLKRSADRARKLVELGALAQAEYERRAAEARNAEATLRSRKAEVARTEQQLRRFGVAAAGVSPAPRSELKATISGVITASTVSLGELKGADEEIFTIQDLSTVWVLADVYERDIPSVRAGQTVDIKINAFPERTFKGKVTYISDVLDPATRAAKVRCEVENPRGDLRLGMFGTVSLPTSGQKEVPTIPLTAIQTVGGHQLVFVREGERIEPREIRLGTTANGRAEVKKGVNTGEFVATEGSFALKSQMLKGQIGGEHGEEEEHD